MHVRVNVNVKNIVKFYIGGKLKYTAASIVPRRYYSDKNILKKLGEAGEKALYEDAENLYNYVTDVLGHKNVIIHGFCLGGDQLLLI